MTTRPLAPGWLRGRGWAGHESIPEVTTAPSGCHSNRNLSYRFLFLTLQSLLRPAALTMSSMCVLLLPLCVAVVPYLTEAEEHRGSAGFLDGQRLRAAQLHQAGPRPEPHHAGRPGHPRPSGSDGFQVSLCVCVCVPVRVWNILEVLEMFFQAGKVREYV